MALVLLLGGARSGKSRLAVSLARERAGPVTVLVTAEARDEEMQARIAAHRAERPGGWETIEEPLLLEAAVAAVPPERTLVLDCLSLWVANLLERGDTPDEIAAAAARAERLGRRPGHAAGPAVPGCPRHRESRLVGRRFPGRPGRRGPSAAAP